MAKAFVWSSPGRTRSSDARLEAPQPASSRSPPEWADPARRGHNGRDRAAAIQQGRKHAALLHDELEIEPDAAVERLIDEITAARDVPPGLVATLPPSAQLSARATLVAEPQVQAALRDLLSHRLWLKEHAQSATLAELESAQKALAGAKTGLATQLARLADVREELDVARTAQAVRATGTPS